MKPFTIIVPVYNEQEILEDNIEKLINYSEGLRVPCEIIIACNGATDSSFDIGERLHKTHPQVVALNLSKKGVGRAFKAGIQKASYGNIIFIDADLSVDLSFIKSANEQLDKFTVVLGTKINGLQNRSLFRKMGSFVFYLSVLILMGLKYIDYAPGAKAFRKDFLLSNFQYIDDYTSFVLNLVFVAHTKGLPITELSIICNDQRKSRFNLWKEAISKYNGLFSLKLKQLLHKI